MSGRITADILLLFFFTGCSLENLGKSGAYFPSFALILWGKKIKEEMSMKTIARITALLLLCGLLCMSAMGAEGETLYNREYCLSRQDFDEEATGILVRSVAEEGVGYFCLGSRRLRAGDVLDTDRLSEISMVPVCTENCDAVLTYCPIYGRSLGEETQLTVKIRSGKNEAPKVEDMELETYKNIANNGKLSGTDPEGANLEFFLAEAPKYGKVEVKTDGTFLYIPGKNKVGQDSFTFTAKDEAGNESLPGKVKIKIMKPSQAKTFGDMEGNNGAFEAMWATEENLMSGVEIAGNLCFCPNMAVTRGEFLAMVMELTDQTIDESLTVSAFLDGEEAAPWLRPYLAAAVRSGIVRGEICEDGLVFRPNDPIKGREAAVILQNILRLPVSVGVRDTTEPAWSAASVQALQESGYSLAPGEILTRQGAVCLLYGIAKG